MQDNKLNINFEDFDDQQLHIAQRMMDILDEDGQPMYNEEWVNQHILGIVKEKEE